MKKKLKLGLGGLVFLCCLLAWSHVWFPRYLAHARQSWKESALPEIRLLADDPRLVAQEIQMLRTVDSPRENIIAAPWLSDRMILMGSGEWLVYKSHCSKEPPRQLTDIFLAKGSNGKWYYSTCHFCMGMVVLTMVQHGNPPRDLATFAKVYHLQEFDGSSDECLKATTLPGLGPDEAVLYEASPPAEPVPVPTPATEDRAGNGQASP